MAFGNTKVFLQASFDSKLFALCLSFPVRYLAVNWSDTKILKHNPFNSSEMVKYELHEMLLENFPSQVDFRVSMYSISSQKFEFCTEQVARKYK